MIPKHLSLTNFMCYRQAELSLAGIGVACLAGENGAGKSALLDAITWALWGKSRARRDDELIRLGEQEMAVEFTFDLGGETFRVMRRRKAGRRGSSLLDFQAHDGKLWRSMAEGRIRETQARIEQTLRLDYETFVNSAFLRQGHADEFTVKTASERKRVLGEILGLDRWEVYEERAKERLQETRVEMELIELRLGEIEDEMARQSDYEAELELAWAAVADLSAKLQHAQAAYQQIEADRMELRGIEDHIAERVEQIAQAQRELSLQAEERVARDARLAECSDLLNQTGDIEAGYVAYEQAVEREKALGAKLLQSVEINERRTALEAQILVARHQIVAERKVIAQRVSELESRLPGEALLAEYGDVRAQVVHLAQLSESREAARADRARIAGLEAELHTRNEVLRAEMDVLRERIQKLEEAEAECPLCEQPLSEKHQMRLLTKLQAEGLGKGDDYRTNQAIVREKSEQSAALERQILEVGRLMQGLNALQRREASLAERVERGRRSDEELVEARAELAEVGERLTSEDYALEVRAELMTVLIQAERLGYDVAAHEEARRAVARGRVFAERKARLEVARTQVEEEMAALDRLEKSQQRWKMRVDTESTRRLTLEVAATELRERLSGAEAVEAELQGVRGEEASARQRLGAAQQRLEASKALGRQRADRRTRLDELAAARSIYQELRTACGVGGVPAMIIEAAVPEIEAEANRLLSRMSGGRMHVRFDTQRETQAGEVRETLEIKIADELGTRPYENYSGGEQFRVNFAIRIALSRLLARRAGTQLQTLVIDEGFGTQDVQGRERLLEAIHIIQADFACVLVITHIEEFKGTFPTRIEVTKGPDGSMIEVL